MRMPASDAIRTWRSIGMWKVNFSRARLNRNADRVASACDQLLRSIGGDDAASVRATTFLEGALSDDPLRRDPIDDVDDIVFAFPSFAALAANGARLGPPHPA